MKGAPTHRCARPDVYPSFRSIGVSSQAWAKRAEQASSDAASRVVHRWRNSRSVIDLGRSGLYPISEVEAGRYGGSIEESLKWGNETNIGVIAVSSQRL